jgi:hypothetical protein
MVSGGNGAWNGRLGAVSLTFDDGRVSQLEKAVPILAEHELRGTFYVNPRGKTEEEWRARLAPWREVQAARHEVGNHSQNHVCSHAFRDRRGSAEQPSLETWTPADVEADVLEAERRLGEAVPLLSGKQRTFCYPCYHEHVGEGATRQSYVPVIAKHFLAARGIGERDNRAATCDLHYLWSWNVELMGGAELVGLAERASQDSWVILTFHDVGRDSRLSNTEDAFNELCGFLARHRERIWTAPVNEVAARVVEWRKGRG